MIYFDHNATTPIDDRVQEAMAPYLQNLYGNPSSLYRFGRIARTAIDTAREQIAELIDVTPAQIVFTSGGTEANALALANVGNASMFISAVEHPSVFENAQARQNRLTVLEVDASGRINPDVFDEHKLQSGDFVAVMLANNETGVIQDIEEIGLRLKERGVSFHCDAVQALGKLSFSFKRLGVQLMSLSSHKIYGPKGCGALVFEPDFVLVPLQRGGFQERGYRAGTENVAAIVGFGKAAELAKAEFEQRTTRIRTLKDKLEEQLLGIPDLIIFSQGAARLPNTVQFGIRDIKGEMLLMKLDRHGIAVSSGSACAASSEENSPVLTAMGVKPALANSAIRISLGKDNNEQEINQFVSVLKTVLSIH